MTLAIEAGVARDAIAVVHTLLSFRNGADSLGVALGVGQHWTTLSIACAVRVFLAIAHWVSTLASSAVFALAFGFTAGLCTDGEALSASNKQAGAACVFAFAHEGTNSTGWVLRAAWNTKLTIGFLVQRFAFQLVWACCFGLADASTLQLTN